MQPIKLKTRVQSIELKTNLVYVTNSYNKLENRFERFMHPLFGSMLFSNINRF